MKKTLTLIVTAAVFAWIVSAAAASYSSLDQFHAAKKPAKSGKVTVANKPRSVTITRVVYVYYPAPAVTATPPDMSRFCADYNDDLVAHAMDPIPCP
jgi:hypothetical protein